MQLLFDIGNSNLKWVTWGSGGYLAGGRLEQDVRQLNADTLQQALSHLAPPDSVRVSNVAGDLVAAELTDAVKTLWGIPPRFASSLKSGYGVTVAYERPEFLGVDRWLTLVAAQNTASVPALIVDCGTAVTLDVIDAHGLHLGGLIVPGDRMMWDALFSRTRMPVVDYQPYAGLLGRSTAECVAAGAVHSIAGLIERLCRQLVEQHGAKWKVLLTGGGAAAVAEQLNLALEQRPHLVFEGLAIL